MEKVKLHGAVLPDGWSVEIWARPEEHIATIKRSVPGAKFGDGFTTIDFNKRIFGPGYCGPWFALYGEKKPHEYTGRGWKKQIVEDACNWLERGMS